MEDKSRTVHHRAWQLILTGDRRRDHALKTFWRVCSSILSYHQLSTWLPLLLRIESRIHKMRWTILDDEPLLLYVYRHQG